MRKRRQKQRQRAKNAATVPVASTITQPTINPPTINANDYTQSFSDQSNYANSLNSDLYGRINQDVEGYETRWADYYDFLQSDPNDNAGYSSIRNSYTEKGKSAAGAAVADGASTNSGNIDSFAAANANRQQIAYENAGADKALDFWNSVASQYGTGLTNQANVTNQARGTQSSLVGNAYGAATDMGAYDFNSRFGTTDTETTVANTAEDSIAEVIKKITNFDANTDTATQMVNAITNLKKDDPQNAYTYDNIKKMFEEWYAEQGEYANIGEFTSTLATLIGWDL